ncbi:alkaline phosphatase-like protein [Lindgomyces ingoldianus]|uniref:Alkaline phosphatase-like protein n=1 Tax=Lindgomyces ingoldianus TaxID=673940 RepID=A0ACB6QBH3_9PLEO|nr:alkaline phosphatase-like protein [Lindgomyces ingoldianus]KAF2464246.1 alkaline phosphatase-like protein [Lindgomyces ingoldianus]
MAPKNILLMIADDLGYHQMSCYGSSTIRTPNLDKFASSGVKFDMAFTSTASCSGSRTVIQTGLHTHQNGSYGLVGEGNGFQTSPNIETAPEIFNELGYKTGILGKVHVAPESKYPWQVREESESRNVAMIADRAEAFFNSSKEENKSFYLTIGFVDPHRQLGIRGGFGNVEGNHDPRIKDRIFKPEDVEIPPFLSDLPEVRQELAEYYRSIHRMDQGVEMILAALDRCSLTSDTLVLFLSDNGPPFINSKTTLYDAGIRLPFLIRVPGQASNTVNPNLISYTDILPTFIDWAGHSSRSQKPGTAHPRLGRSILPILISIQENPNWSSVFGSHTFHEITNYWPTRYIRTRRFKYHRNVCWRLDFPFAMDLYASLSFESIRNAPNPTIGQRPLSNYIFRPAEELYDLARDPAEVRNIAGLKEYESVLRDMRAQLEKWQEETGDLWLWRDGTSIIRYKQHGYGREGLRIPDRFDFEVERPGNRAGPAVKL